MRALRPRRLVDRGVRSSAQRFPMPLPTSPVPRQRLHVSAASPTKAIGATTACSTSMRICVDAKDHDFELVTGVRPAREAVHDMWVRVTIDREFVDSRDRGAHRRHALSGRVRPDRACVLRSSSARISCRGFRKRLHDDMGGIAGCTHVTELLGSLPTAAVQTFAGLRREDEGEGKPFQLDHCHALETTTDTVRRYYPKWYGARDPCVIPRTRNPVSSPTRSAHAMPPPTREDDGRREDPRIPGQGDLPPVRHGDAARHSGVHRRRSRARGAIARRRRLGRQGADPRRRPRQGRRRQGRALASTKCASAPARSSACSSSRTRPAPPARRCAAC